MLIFFGAMSGVLFGKVMIKRPFSIVALTLLSRDECIRVIDIRFYLASHPEATESPSGTCRTSPPDHAAMIPQIAKSYAPEKVVKLIDLWWIADRH